MPDVGYSRGRFGDATAPYGIGAFRRLQRVVARRREDSPSGNRSCPLCQQLPHHRAMTPPLILTVAPYGEVRCVRQGGKKIQYSARLWTAHLGPIALGERAPAAVVLRSQGYLQERLARRQAREPHVVEVAGREFVLGDASRRTPDRTDPQALTLRPRTPKPDDPDCHHPPSADGAGRRPLAFSGGHHACHPRPTASTRW